MNNELKINRLLEYRFKFFDSEDIVSTGDAIKFDEQMQGYIVMRTGNPIRYVLDRPMEIIITPVDA